MNNFPAMTEEQRQELIKRFTLEISRLNNKRDAAQSEDRYFSGGDLWALQAFEIALAALTAEPKAYLIHEKARASWLSFQNAKGFNPKDLENHEIWQEPLYTAPPAPVLKPIELPKKYVCDKNGYDDDLLPSWQVMISCDEIIAAIRAAGYEVKP